MVATLHQRSRPRTAADLAVHSRHRQHGTVHIAITGSQGLIGRELTPFKMGGGGVIGNGRQHWSLISLDNAADALHHALLTDSICGPVNVVAPDPVTNAAFTNP